MSERSMADFERELQAGNEYEDYVQHVLWQRGYFFILHRSAKYQWSHGESIGGNEIKLDRLFRSTGNLYIETAERRTTEDASQWRASGICDTPQPRIYTIGDRQTIYVLPVRWLHCVRHKCEAHDGDTMQGFKLPVTSATKGAIEIIELGDKGEETSTP